MINGNTPYIKDYFKSMLERLDVLEEDIIKWDKRVHERLVQLRKEIEEYSNNLKKES